MIFNVHIDYTVPVNEIIIDSLKQEENWGKTNQYFQFKTPSK